MRIVIDPRYTDRLWDCVVTAIFGIATLLFVWFMHSEDLSLLRFVWTICALLCDFMTGWGALVLAWHMWTVNRRPPDGGIPIPRYRTTPCSARGRMFTLVVAA